jgi:hypothetical protein
MAKHRFSKQHFSMVKTKFQGSLPSFTCPAFMAMNGKCKSAKSVVFFFGGGRFASDLPTIESRRSDPLHSTSFFLFFLGGALSFRAGRYDSAMRHCGNCVGFKELDVRASIFPVEVTQEEFDSMQEYRKMKHPEAETTFPLPVQSVVCKVLDIVMNGGMSSESTTSGDSFGADALDAGDVPTAQQHSPFLNNGEVEKYGNYHDLLSF